jgi:uncharacterized protein YhhL (DUF1145 family)
MAVDSCKFVTLPLILLYDELAGLLSLPLLFLLVVHRAELLLVLGRIQSRPSCMDTPYLGKEVYGLK